MRVGSADSAKQRTLSKCARHLSFFAGSVTVEGGVIGLVISLPTVA